MKKEEIGQRGAQESGQKQPGQSIFTEGEEIADRSRQGCKAPAEAPQQQEADRGRGHAGIAQASAGRMEQVLPGSRPTGEIEVFQHARRPFDQPDGKDIAQAPAVGNDRRHDEGSAERRRQSPRRQDPAVPEAQKSHQSGDDQGRHQGAQKKHFELSGQGEKKCGQGQVLFSAAFDAADKGEGAGKNEGQGRKERIQAKNIEEIKSKKGIAA